MRHTRSLSALMLALSAGIAAAQWAGPSSSQTPYLLPTAGGVQTTSILTVGDSVGGYRLSGILDGLGAMSNGDGTFTLMADHEFGATQGVVRAHGSTGSWVSSWLIDSATLEVFSGHDLFSSTYVWNTGAGVFDAQTTAMDRLCSADLPPVSSLYNSASGKGTTSRIFFSGEETRPPFTSDHGRAFAHVVTGSLAGTSWQLPWYGRMAWENLLHSPFEQDLTIAFCMDDADRNTQSETPCEVYMYVGERLTRAMILRAPG